MLGHRPYGYYNDNYYGQPYHHHSPGHCFTHASNNVQANAPYPYGVITGSESLAMAPYYFSHHIEVHEITRYEKPKKLNSENQDQMLQNSQILPSNLSQTPTAASLSTTENSPAACSSELKNFMECANRENANLSLCTAFNDIYLACKKNVASMVEEKN